MDVVPSNFLPGDPRLIEQIVYELKSQGIFDQFRKECIADVDTKPAYQNLSQRVEGSVMSFLNQQRFTEDINKNQLREQLRKNITESGFLESGVERIVDQVVNPKINTIFLPKVEDVVYRFLGIERPNQVNKQLSVKQNVEDLLPNDLEAVSPESVNDQKNNDNVMEANDNSLNSSNTKTEDESPPFEPLEENTKFSVHEENSVDSHLSGISGLASHDSAQSSDIKMDISQDVSQNSINSEGNLSIVTSEEGTKMEICEDSISGPGDNFVVSMNKTGELESKIASDVRPDKVEVENANNLPDTHREANSKGNEENKRDSVKGDAKKTHEKHRSSRSDKDRKDDKEKRSRSKSDGKREKSSSKSTSSSKDKEKDKKGQSGKEEISEKSKVSRKEEKEKDKNKEKSSSRTKDKEKSDRSRDRSEKSKDKSAKDRERSDKEKTNRDESYKDKLDKEKSKTDTDKHKSSRDKDKSDKIKSEKDNYERDKSSSSKNTKEKTSNPLNKDRKDGDKYEDKSSNDKNSSSKDKSFSSNKHKESSSKDKRSSSNDKDSSKSLKDRDKSKTSSSGSKEKEKDRKAGGDLKSKASDKYKKHDKDKHSSSDKNNLPSKKNKDKKVTDDHYGMKDKKSDRRSTDRDSNDGSSKTSRNSSLADTYSNSQRGSHKEPSEMFSSGGGESSNSDQVEENSAEECQDCFNSSNSEVTPPIKYIKPKFASNIHEAMKIMKIRKMLAKLERQNQLALANVPVVSENSFDLQTQQISNMGENPRSMSLNTDNALSTKSVEKQTSEIESTQLIESNEKGLYYDFESKKSIEITSEVEGAPLLKSHDLSLESFEALEARLAEEMSNINVHMYGDEDDNYEYSSIIISPIKNCEVPEDPIVPNNEPLTKNLGLGSNSTEQISISERTKEVENKEVQDTCANPGLLTESELQKTTLESEVINNFSKGTVSYFAGDNLDTELELVVEEQVEVAVEEVPFMSHEHATSDNLIIDSCVQETDTDAVDISDHMDNTENIHVYSQDLKAIQKEEPTSEINLSEGFKGFKASDKDGSLLMSINQLINKISNDMNKKYIKSHQELCGINVDSVVNLRKVSRRSQLQNLVGRCSLGSPLRAGIKESKHKACLQKNGKKLFINIDKLNIEVTPKVLVTLQDAGLDEVVKGRITDKISVLNDVKDSVPNGAKERISLSFTRGLGIKQNGQVTTNDENPTVISSRNVTINPFIEDRVNEESLTVKWEDESSPCFFFDKTKNESDTHLTILKDAIGKLQKSIEDQSLKIQNNIPTPKKRGRKKKAPSENNNSLCCDYKPERKRRLLSDANSNQNLDNNMCNTNVSSQSFTLPLSPAESDKSGEQNKEEPVTVKIKRTKRGTATKRYASEDLYKPRPILSCTSSRRRSSRIDDNRP